MGMTHGKIVIRDALDYSDVFIIPQYSEISTRTEIDTSARIGGLTLRVPVISANMDTITGSAMSIAMQQKGGIGAMHRFMSVAENAAEYTNHYQMNNQDTFVSIGVNRDSKERAEALYCIGARHFVIDIAHGHSKSMKDMLTWMKATFKDIHVMAGNVATNNGVCDLVQWEADSIKVGIGPGSVCLTKDVTGVTVPQLTAVLDCAYAARSIRSPYIPVIADGGIKSIGDVAKALAAGADFVMLGGMLAGCDECPGEVINNSKVYRGMASKGAMMQVRPEDEQMPTPEGKVMIVPCKGPVGTILNDIAGGLRSAMSYSNASNIDEFHDKVLLGFRKSIRHA